MDTSSVATLLSKAAARRHITLRRAFLDVAGPFPVAGPASWSNDWHAFRPCPFPHLHEGLDIFATEGTPVVATVSGSVTERIDDDVSGLGLQVTGPHGMEYVYAHLSAFADGLLVDERVQQGQVIGFVGSTGDARGGSAHLHFEVQPGGIPMPPKPLVDRWLLREELAARSLPAPRHPARAITNPRWFARLLPDDSVSNAGTSAGSERVDRRETVAVRNVSALSSSSPVVAYGFLAGMGTILVLALFARRRTPR